MNKVKLIIILSLVLTLSLLITIPANANEGIEPGKKTTGPYGIDACDCGVVPFECWCIHH